jgi:hypothetical protein
LSDRICPAEGNLGSSFPLPEQSDLAFPAFVT